MPGGVCSNNPYRRVNNERYCKGSHYLSFEQHHKSLIFNPAYLDYMKDFKVVRFMNMSGITRNPISNWDDPWFNLPHKADNNYVRQYAKYVKDNLKPGLKAYVEYTNEAWNSIFTQAHYVKDMGEKFKLDEDRDKAGYKYFSLRSVQIFDMWEQTFGGTDRIVRVMGSWTGWTRLSEMISSLS